MTQRNPEVVMGDKLTPRQVKRDDFLRSLALDPNEALRHWKRLKPGEPLVVITYMTLAYGPTFAQHFKKEADRRKRPETVYSVTNLPSVNPATLTKQGYKFQRWLVPPDMGGGWPSLSIWVHPTGKEIWLIQSAKAAPPAPVAAKPSPPVHPDIEELRLYVSQYTARKNDMIRKGRELEGMRSSLSKPQYQQLRKEWWDDYGAWDEELDEIFEEVIPDMTDDLTPDEQKQKNAEIEKLKALKSSPWPADVFNPKG